MTQVILEFEPGAMSALRTGTNEFAQEVKTAAVIQLVRRGTGVAIEGVRSPGYQPRRVLNGIVSAQGPRVPSRHRRGA